MKEYPYEFCRNCGGEGVDTDPYGFFDYPCYGKCKDCDMWEWEDTIEDAKCAADEAYHGF